MPRFERSALPNLITLARIAIAPAVFTLVFVRGFWPGLLTFLLFLTAAISDLWDGYLARKHGWISDFGKFWDPIADKLLIVATFVPIYILSHRDAPTGTLPFIGELPLWILLVIFGREVLITFIRSLAVRRGVVIPAGRLGKHKAVYQNIFVGAALFWYALQDAALEHGWSGSLWAAWQLFHSAVTMIALAVALVLTVWSMLAYLWAWRSLMRRATA